MKKWREKKKKKKYIRYELLRKKQNLENFFAMEVGIKEVKRA